MRLGIWQMERRLGRWWPLMVWSALIFVGSSLPGAKVAEQFWLDWLVHKIAHLLEYSGLAILARRALGSWRWALIYGGLYALTDEYHQLFVPGRQGRWLDWLIDLGGLTLGWAFWSRWLFPQITTKSQVATQQLGRKWAASLRPGAIWGLYGDLGSGKTTFIQGVLAGLGYSGRVLSPTFTLARQYRLPQAVNGVQVVNHLDGYRLGEASEAESLGLADFYQEPGAVTLIEWPDRLGRELPGRAGRIFFKDGGGERRQIAWGKL